MLIRIASIVLRICGALAVLLGLLFWTGNALNFVGLHMLLGVLVVLSLWAIGIGQALAPGGSWPLAAVALVTGVVVVLVGIRQSTLLVGPLHWLIQVAHLLLGVLAVGIGQACAARYRKGGVSVAAQAS
jgi:hypothetical protein